MNLTFTGGRELARTLRELPEAIAQNVLVGAVAAGAGIIREAAVAKCPRRGERRRSSTVRLADSIKVTVTEQSRSFVTVNVGTNVRYAHLVEYGHQIVPRGPGRVTIASVTTVSKTGRAGKAQTKLRRIAPDAERRALLRSMLKERRGVGSGGFVPARPFLRPAFDENSEAVIQKIGTVLGVGIEACAKQLASQSFDTPTILSSAV